MKKRLLVLLVLISLPLTPLSAVHYIAFEMLTVDATAGGVRFTATKVDSTTTTGSADLAVCRLEGAQIRYTVDSTAPTTTIGTIMEVGDVVQVQGHDLIVRFRSIRTTGVSGILSCNYTQQ